VSTWAVPAVIYGAVLLVAALTHPIRRKAAAAACVLLYTAAAGVAGLWFDVLWADLAIPGALLLTGYWLSGFFYRDPQAWLEAWLLRVDRAFAAEQWMSRLPRPVQELLELSYALDYVVIGGGAIYTAFFGADAVARYWTLVLASELGSFAPLPWLRSRPPRAITSSSSSVPGTQKMHGARHLAVSAPPRMRRLNTAILDSASVQANTLPSGHVSGAVAAALGVWTVDPMAGAWLMVMAGLIAVAAIAGRYHYVVDCVAGAAVAAAFSSLI
jgi:hypothetical protein